MEFYLISGVLGVFILKNITEQPDTTWLDKKQQRLEKLGGTQMNYDSTQITATFANAVEPKRWRVGDFFARKARAHTDAFSFSSSGEQNTSRRRSGMETRIDLNYIRGGPIGPRNRLYKNIG